GRLIWGTNSRGDWVSGNNDFTSNLPPELGSCFSNEMSCCGGPTGFIRFGGPITIADQLEWIERIKWWPDWFQASGCATYNSYPHPYLGVTLPIDDLEIAVSCFACEGCAPYFDALIFHLPDGVFDVTYTNGIDTFELFDIMDLHSVPVEIFSPINYWLVSVEEVGACPLPATFTGEANITVPVFDAGEFKAYYLCENWMGDDLQLIYFLGGTPDPGGSWYGPNGYPTGSTWDPSDGEGLFTYYIFDVPGPCTPPFDTASVLIQYMDMDSTTIEVGCDQSGTPDIIEDDAIVLTVTVNGHGISFYYGISVVLGSEIVPENGYTGVPTTFLLAPGTATGPDLHINIQEWSILGCDFDFIIEAPGYCSDPCNHDMISYLTGPEDICVENCQEEPETIVIETDWSNFSLKMDFSLTAPGYPSWNFMNIPIEDYHEIQICVDSVPAPTYNSTTGYLTIPIFLAGSDVTFNLLEVSDFYDCTGILDETEVTMAIHPLPTINTTSLTFCFEDALLVDLTEYDLLISSFLDVRWFNGDPEGGNQIFNANSVNLTEVDQLFAQVSDDYCKKSIQIPLTIFPQPNLDSVPPINVCQGESIVLQNITLVDAGNSMATYTFHAGLPPDSTNRLDPLVYIPADSTTIYVHATSSVGMCYDTLPIIFNVEDYPDFVLQATPCDLLAGTYSVLFTSSADSIHASAGVVTNNPSGQDAVTGIPNNLNIWIEVLNPTSLCRDTFQIAAPNCNCPQINQPIAVTSSFAICEN
ncbi:MAG TPA: hypothetical protein VGK46_10025, partial [Saprospiraceae bacterium]